MGILRDFVSILYSIVGYCLPFFVLFCLAIFWTSFIKFIFSFLKIDNLGLKIYISFIPLYIYFLYLIVIYGIDLTLSLFWFSKSYYIPIRDFISEFLLHSLQ